MVLDDEEEEWKVKKHRRVAARSSGTTDVMSQTKKIARFQSLGMRACERNGLQVNRGTDLVHRRLACICCRWRRNETRTATNWETQEIRIEDTMPEGRAEALQWFKESLA